MVVPGLPGAKLVVGKIAEQVAIQAAAELLLRRLLPGRRRSDAPDDNPIADLELQALMQTIAAPGGLIEQQSHKKRPSRFNRLVSKHIKELKRKHPKMQTNTRFAKATKLASKELKASRNKRRRK